MKGNGIDLFKKIVFTLIILIEAAFAGANIEHASGEEPDFKWYFISGYNGPPSEVGEFARITGGCSPSVIWYYNGLTETWYAWFPIFESLDWEILSLFTNRIDWLYASRAYWIACPNKDHGPSGTYLTQLV